MSKCSRFEVLDSWRGICAIFVVVFHSVAAMPSSIGTSLLVRNSYLFVDFFFVLSGFVLCHSYREKIGSAADFGRFALRRLGRIWPLHATVLLGLVLAVAIINRLPHPDGLALTWDRNSFAIDAILPSLLLLNAVHLQGSVWNGPAWSIGAEFYVYLLFACLLLVAPRRLVSASAIVSLGALALIFWLAPDLMNTTWDYGLIRCMAGFFAGVLAFHGYERLAQVELFKATIWELAAAILVVLFVIYAGDGPDRVSTVSLAAPFAFGIAVIVFAGERGLLSLMLRARPFRALGRYSFSIYMIHQPMLILLCYGLWSLGHRTKMFGAAAGRSATGSPDLLLIDFVLAVVVLSAASYRFVEMPARHRVNMLAERLWRGRAIPRRDGSVTLEERERAPA